MQTLGRSLPQTACELVHEIMCSILDDQVVIDRLFPSGESKMDSVDTEELNRTLTQFLNEEMTGEDERLMVAMKAELEFLASPPSPEVLKKTRLRVFVEVFCATWSEIMRWSLKDADMHKLDENGLPPISERVQCAVDCNMNQQGIDNESFLRLCREVAKQIKVSMKECDITVLSLTGKELSISLHNETLFVMRSMRNL